MCSEGVALGYAEVAFQATITALTRAKRERIVLATRPGGLPVRGLWVSETVNNLGENDPQKAQPIVVKRIRRSLILCFRLYSIG